MIKLDDLKVLTLAPGINARIVTGDSMTVAHVRLDAGARLPEHKHVHEQVVNVISGELELIVAGIPHILTAGQVFVLASNVPHAANANADCYVIDVFHPVREDFFQIGFSGYGSGAK
jgi:quercetin dioxygenase-like cupin family protein